MLDEEEREDSGSSTLLDAIRAVSNFYLTPTQWEKGAITPGDVVNPMEVRDCEKAHEALAKKKIKQQLYTVRDALASVLLICFHGIAIRGTYWSTFLDILTEWLGETKILKNDNLMVELDKRPEEVKLVVKLAMVRQLSLSSFFEEPTWHS